MERAEKLIKEAFDLVRTEGVMPTTEIDSAESREMKQLYNKIRNARDMTILFRLKSKQFPALRERLGTTNYIEKQAASER